MKPLDMKPDTRSQRWRDAEARITASYAHPDDLAIVAEEQAKWDAERLDEFASSLVSGPVRSVYHAATGVVGRVVGVNHRNTYVSPVNGQPVPGIVLELDSGHAVTLKSEEDVVVLSDGEVALVDGVQKILRATLENTMRLGAAMGLRFEAVVLMTTAVLRHQANQIEASAGPKPDVY